MFLSNSTNAIQFLDVHSPPRLVLQFRYSFFGRYGIFGKRSIHKTSTSTQLRKEDCKAATLACSTSPTIVGNNITWIHIGEQIEVEVEDRSVPQAYPSARESSDGCCPPLPVSSHISYHSHADIPAHSLLPNHLSPSPAHHKGRPSPAGSGSVYEAFSSLGTT